MKLLNGIAAVLMVAASSVSLAAAPGLTASQSITINATPAKVWDAVKNFDALNSWHPAVAKDEIVSGKNNVVGAERLLTLGDGGTINEKLLEYSDADRSFKYSILKGALPVSDYTSTFVVKESGKGQSTVTWSGAFKRKNTGDMPAANENDEAATTTMNAVYKGGLDNLKKKLETM